MKKFYSSLKKNFFSLKFIGFLFIILNSNLGKAQILNPADPVPIYNSANPPVQPAANTIGKWVITPTITNWNTSVYKPYIYNGMCFRLMYPTSYKPGVNDGKKYPLIIMFHGDGELGTIYNNDKQLVHGGQNTANAESSGAIDAFALFPQIPYSAWNTQNFAYVAGIIDYMVANSKVDPQRVVIHGLSAGGDGAFGFLLNQGKYVAAAVPMSTPSLPNYAATGGIIKNRYTPIWTSQGGLDINPPPSIGQRDYNNLHAVGANNIYSYFPNDGHDTWDDMYANPDFFPYLMRANKSNPWAVYGRTQFCISDAIIDTLGIYPGFDGYQWMKDGTVIPGATSNIYVANQTGTYSARYLNGTTWSTWSPTPLVISIKAPTITPAIQLAYKQSNIIPSPDSSKGVYLTVPGAFIHYAWVKAGTTTVIDTNKIFLAKTPGNYQVTVTELYGCSGNYSPIYTVVSASGTGAPDTVGNFKFSQIGISKLTLAWTKSTATTNLPTGFELYRSTNSTGPFTYISLIPSTQLTYIDSNLNPHTNYYYQMRAVNNSGASSNSKIINASTLADVTPPTTPSNLVLFPGSTQATLTWGASTDNVGVTNYYIYVNGVKTYATTSTTYTIVGLTKGQSYYFTVKATDLSGNLSNASNQVSGVMVDYGFNYKYYTYTGSWSKLADLNALTPVKVGNSATIDLTPKTQTTNFAFLWTGTIRIPVAGNYTFITNSDDGSNLYIDQPYSYTATPTINNDGLHGAQNKSVTLNLSQGDHTIALAYFQASGGYSVSLSWQNTANGITTSQVIPASYFVPASVSKAGFPGTPKSLTANALSSNQVKLTWVDSLGTQTGVEVYRSTSSTGTYLILGTTPGNSTFYTDTSGLLNNTTYYYKIRAINNLGASNYSLLVSAKTSSAAVKPNVPTSLTGIVLSQTKLKLSWSDNVSNITNFNLLRSAVDTLHFLNIGSIPAGSSSIINYTDSLLSPNTHYTYKVSAQNAVGSSGYSTLLTLTTLSYPPPVFAKLGPQTIKYGSSLNINLFASDPHGTGITFSGIALPGFAKVTSSNGSGLLSLNPLISDTGTYKLILTATDANGVSKDTLNLKVNKVASPVISSISPLTLVEGNTSSFKLSATDLNTGAIFTWSNTSSPAFFKGTQNADGTYTINLTPALSDTGIYNPVITVADGLGGTSSNSFQLTIITPAQVVTIPTTSFLAATGVSTSSINLNWTPAAGTSKYYILRSVSSSGPFVLIDSVLGSVTSYSNISLTPNTTYYYQLKSRNSQGVLSGVNNIASAFTLEYLVEIGFNSDQPGPSPWNNTNAQPYLGQTLTNLINTSAIGTGINLTTVKHSFTGANTLGAVTGNNSGIYPDNIIRGQYYVQTPDTAVLQISGLALSKAYDFIFFGSWGNPFGTGVGSYTINGKTVTLDAANNNSKTVSINNVVPDVNGNVLITIKAAPGSTFGIISALVIKSHLQPPIVPAPPVFNPIAAQSMYVGTSLSLNLTSSDPSGATITLSGTNLPSFAAVTNSGKGLGTLTLNPGVADSGTYKLVLLASDVNGITSDTVNLKVNKVVPPVISSISPLTLKAGDSITLKLTAKDVNVGAVLKWTLTNSASFMSSVQNGDGSFSITLKPKATDTGTFSPTVNLVDGFLGGNSSFNLSVKVNSNYAPIISAISAVTLRVGDSTTLKLTATDANKGAVLNWSLTNAPGFAKGVQNSDASFTITLKPKATDSGTYSPKVSVSDGFPNGNSSANLAVRVNYNFPPLISNISPIIMKAGDSVNLKVSATDNNQGAVLNWSLTNAPGFVKTLQNADGSFSMIFKPKATDTGSYSPSLNVSDGLLGGNSSKTFSLRVNSVYVPIISTIAPVTLIVGDSTNLKITATDANIGAVLKWTLTSSPSFIKSIQNADGSFTLNIKPQTADTGSYNPVVNVTDGFVGGNNSSTFAVKINPKVIVVNPNPPTSVSAQGATVNSISLTWISNPGAFKNLIYRSTSPTGPFFLIDSVAGNIGTYTNNSLNSGTTYYYQLVTENSNWTLSIPSSTVNLTTLTAPSGYSIEISMTSDIASPLPWNSTNTSSPFTGYGLPKLKNTSGVATNVNFNVIQSFHGVNTLGVVTGNNSGLYPDNVSRSFFYTQSQYQPKPDSATVQISGLTQGMGYDFVFFCSWANPQWTGISNYTINGVTASLDPSNNTSKTTQIGNVLPDVNGNVFIRVNAAPGTAFGLLNSIVINAHALVAGAPNNTVSVGNLQSAVQFNPIPLAITESKVSVYPVPFTGPIDVQINSIANGNYKISILNVRGQTLYTEPLRVLNQGITYRKLNNEVNGLDPGVYFIKVDSDVFGSKSTTVIKK